MKRTRNLRVATLRQSALLFYFHIFQGAAIQRLILIAAQLSFLLLVCAQSARADFAAGMAAFRANDYQTALQEWRPLAEQGVAKAQYMLDFMYESGLGVERNATEAAQWCHKAAEQGYAGAQSNLGIRYAAGRGVPQDDVLAVFWFRKAAEQEDALAQINLGVMYASGRGVSPSRVAAYALFKVSALSTLTPQPRTLKNG